MKKPTAILFDMDGLMIDSEQTRAESFKIVIRKHGGIVKENIPQIIGVRALDNWKIMQKRYGLSESPDQLLEEGEAEYTKLIQKDMPLVMPGLFHLIDHIKKMNLKRAVVSSSRMEHITLKLNKLKIDDFFQAIVSGDMVTNGKPNPEGYLVAAGKLNVNPADCLVLEDAPSGVLAAKAAGMSCIAIPSPYSINGDFSQADYILKNLDEVIPLLG
jgi:HAD superfamily hydrolase (TIGR01509 family)